MGKLEITLLVGAAMWMNFQWNYLTPRPRHAWHHRADSRARWYLHAGQHRGGHGALAAAGRTR
jgi:hypothetical protein